MDELTLARGNRTGDTAVDQRTAQVRALRAKAANWLPRRTRIHKRLADTQEAARYLVEHGLFFATNWHRVTSRVCVTVCLVVSQRCHHRPASGSMHVFR